MSHSRELQRLEMDKQGFARTWQILHQGVFGTEALERPPQSEAELAVAPGMVAGVWQAVEPEKFLTAHLGWRRIFPNHQDMHAETVFDLASLTKIIGTTTLAATLVDRGWLSWDLSISSVFPQYPHRRIKIRHLMTHTSGLIWWKPFFETINHHFAPTSIWRVPVSQRQKLMRDLVFAEKPQRAVNEKIEYSDLNFMILGFVLEEILGLSLDEAIQSYVFDRMGMETAFFRRTRRSVHEELMPTVAATENCPWRGGVLQGQVHDDNCFAMGGFGGHSGMFGSIRDVFQFVRCLYQGFLSSEVLKAIWFPALNLQGNRRTLGWDCKSLSGPSSIGACFSDETVGHLGFTGTSLWIDLRAGLAVALLTNRVHPSRANEKIKAFRPQFHDALRQDFATISP